MVTPVELSLNDTLAINEAIRMVDAERDGDFAVVTVRIELPIAATGEMPQKRLAVYRRGYGDVDGPLDDAQTTAAVAAKNWRGNRVACCGLCHGLGYVQQPVGQTVDVKA